MLIKRLLEPNKFDFWLAVLWTSIIILLCFRAPAVEKEFYFPNVDKVAHSIFYLTFVILWYRYMLFIGLKDKKYKVYLFVVAVVLGLLIELAQAFLTTNRQGDVLDAVANALGCLLGIVVVSILYKKGD